MNFLITDEEGNIVQSNKIYDHKKSAFNGRTQDHQELLHDLGQRFSMADVPQPLEPRGWFVDSRRLPRRRPIMPIEMSHVSIRAGENYATKLAGIVRGAKVVVRARMFAEPLHEVTVTDGTLEISVPTPGLYSIEIAKFPYQDWRSDLEVTP